MEREREREKEREREREREREMRLQKAQKCEDNIESTGKHVKTQRPQAIILTYACLNICLPD